MSVGVVTAIDVLSPKIKLQYPPTQEGNIRLDKKGTNMYKFGKMLTGKGDAQL